MGLYDILEFLCVVIKFYTIDTIISSEYSYFGSNA